MGIIAWIVFGAIVGWIASMVMGTEGTLLSDIVLGIVGALLGGWLVSFFGGTSAIQFNLYSFVVSLIGAIVLIAIVRAVR